MTIMRHDSVTTSWGWVSYCVGGTLAGGLIAYLLPLWLVPAFCGLVVGYTVSLFARGWVRPEISAIPYPNKMHLAIRDPFEFEHGEVCVCSRRMNDPIHVEIERGRF